MKKTFIDWVEIEVTPEEEEVWQNFLTKQYELKQREINLETTIPKEIKDGIQ